MYEVALEKWQLFGALVIELNTVCKLWVYSKNVFTNFFVELTVVNDYTAVVIVQFFTKNTNRKVKVAVDKSWSCLLYTSPSPRDRTRSRMPSSA